MSTGNHEDRTKVSAGINPLKPVAIALGIRNKFVENSYVLNISFGANSGNSACPNNYLVYGMHGGHGGGRRAGATANALQEMSWVRPDMDLYIHSHTHTKINYNDIILLYNRKTKKTVEHQRTFYNANAFLKYGGYAEKKGYKPTDRTPSVITVNAIRTKDGMITKTNIIRI